MKEITSKENGAIKQALRLKKKKYRLTEGLYLIEGHKMVKEILACPKNLVRVFLTSESLDNYYPILMDQPEVECLLVNQRIMDRLSDTESPQGVIALARIPHPEVQLLKKRAGLLLLLDQIQDPGNMGTMIRTAWGFAVDAVLLTPDCVDPFNPKVVRASMGGIIHVPVIENVDCAVLKDFKSNGYEILGSLPSAEESIFDQDFTGGRIIVIGNESRGISRNVQNLCDHNFKIPINPRVDSLNAAIACAIITVEALRQRSSVLLS